MKSIWFNKNTYASFTFGLFGLILVGFSILNWSRLTLPEKSLRIVGKITDITLRLNGRRYLTIWENRWELSLNAASATYRIHSAYVQDPSQLRGHDVAFIISQYDSSKMNSSSKIDAYEVMPLDTVRTPLGKRVVFVNSPVSMAIIFGGIMLVFAFVLAPSFRRKKRHLKAA